MNEPKANYTKVYLETIIDSNNELNTAFVVLKDESDAMMFPVAIKPAFFSYLKTISDDKNYEETFLCDRLHALDTPKAIYIADKLNGIDSYYLNKKEEKINLNIIDLLSIVLRYSTDLYIENKLILLEEEHFIHADKESKVDLYRLDKQLFSDSKH